MKYELDLFGVIVPSLILWAILAYGLASSCASSSAAPVCTA